MASQKAMAKIMAVCTLAEASGLRPIDSIALPAKRPIAKAGNIPPIAMVTPAPILFSVSAVKPEATCMSSFSAAIFLGDLSVPIDAATGLNFLTVGSTGRLVISVL